MSQLAALSLSIGVLGGIATYLFLSVGGLLIWAAFVAWGCYFHTGGNTDALRNTIVSNVFGSLVAWAAALIILSVPLADKLTLPLWAAIVVGATVWLICIAANVKALATIPANVYGYACTFAFLLQTPDKLNVASLTSFSLDNAFIAVSVSMIIGAVFALVSGKVGAALTEKGVSAA